MVAFPRINASKPAPSRRFSTFSTPSVGSFPRKNRSPTLAPCDPGFHPAIEQSRSLPPCGARKKSSRCSLARFFDRRISSNPCRSASAFGGTNRSPAPARRDPPPPPTPSPRGGGQKQGPRISPGAVGLFIFGFSPPARSPPRCALLRQHPPPRSGR